MKIKGFILLLFSTFCFGQPSLPSSCPDVIDIQMVGLSNNVVIDNIGHYWAGRNNQFYNTPLMWTFAIGDIYAPTPAAALAEAKEALLSLKYLTGPVIIFHDEWLCLYSNDEGFQSGAVTPPYKTLVPYVR